MELKRRAFSACLLAGGITLFAAMPFAQTAAAPPPSTLPLRLTGVMADDKAAATSVCFIQCLNSDERHGALAIGDVACGVAEVKEIHETAVVIRNIAANRLEVLGFPADARRPTGRPPALVVPAPPAPAPPKKEPDSEPAPTAMTVEVPKATVESYLSNLDDLLQSALAVPHYSEAASGQRVIDGFTLSRIKEGGAAEQVGLRDGDLVQEVNGQPLDSMATVMALLGGVPTMTQAKVKVLRAGQPLTIVINVK